MFRLLTPSACAVIIAFGGVITHLPLRLNQAGVIPIIFAISIMLFPALIAQFFVNAEIPRDCGRSADSN